MNNRTYTFFSMILFFGTNQYPVKLYYSIIFLVTLLVLGCNNQLEPHICPPCNLPCDTLTFSQSGICPHCNMKLLKKSDLVINDINIRNGSGFFQIDGGNDDPTKTITVFYHKPASFTTNSKILLVIPGAGRNGDSYRDAWVEASEELNLLILSPMFPEIGYGFEDYHLCGLIDNSNLGNSITYIENTNKVQLDENQFEFRVNANSEERIFKDFDRIFDLVKQTLNSTQVTYDIFGHSAGGHILHRLALFGKTTKADRILAANASFYTVPDWETDFPFGLKEGPIDTVTLKQAFEKKLVLLLGELDNADETGGTFLHSESADQQGLHRLARGQYFFQKAEEMAQELEYDFNWQLIVVPEVGHDQELMGKAAAAYLRKMRD